jgi:hypothetical protein
MDDALERLRLAAEEAAERRNRSDPNARGRFRFNIGKVFPESDTVARFMVVMAMISNDWVRSTELPHAHREDDGGGVLLLLMRQQVAMVHEAAMFLEESRRRFPEINAFVSNLGDDAQTLVRRIIARDDPASEEHQAWRKPLRNVTAHYPILHPQKHKAGQEELAIALGKASAEDGGVRWDRSVELGIRYEFADEVVVALMPPAERCR